MRNALFALHGVAGICLVEKLLPNLDNVPFINTWKGCGCMCVHVWFGMLPIVEWSL